MQAYIGIAFGCVFAAVSIIISCYLCIKELYYSSEDKSFSSRRKQPSQNYILTNPQPIVPHYSHQPPIPRIITPNENVCLRSICLEYFRSLNLPEQYFEHQYNRCYCSRDYPRNKPKTHKIGGHAYTIPCGWMRFGLKCSIAHGGNEDFFRIWARSYYGTPQNQLENILRNRFIPFPGDVLLNNEVFSSRFHDPNHCYTSPSIYYTSSLQVCEKRNFISQSNETYQVQVILQCKQKPNIFEVMYGRSGLCRIIPHDQIKWKSRT